MVDRRTHFCMLSLNMAGSNDQSQGTTQKRGGGGGEGAFGGKSMNIFINEGCIQNLKGLQIDEGLSRLRWSGSVGLSNLTPE